MPAPCRSHYVDHRIQRGQKTVAVNSGLEMLDKGHDRVPTYISYYSTSLSALSCALYSST